VIYARPRWLLFLKWIPENVMILCLTSELRSMYIHNRHLESGRTQFQIDHFEIFRLMISHIFCLYHFVTAEEER
jgi:hypothetical protein